MISRDIYVPEPEVTGGLGPILDRRNVQTIKWQWRTTPSFVQPYTGLIHYASLCQVDHVGGLQLPIVKKIKITYLRLKDLTCQDCLLYLIRLIPCRCANRTQNYWLALHKSLHIYDPHAHLSLASPDKASILRNLSPWSDTRHCTDELNDKVPELAQAAEYPSDLQDHLSHLHTVASSTFNRLLQGFFVLFTSGLRHRFEGPDTLSSAANESHCFLHRSGKMCLVSSGGRISRMRSVLWRACRFKIERFSSVCATTFCFQAVWSCSGWSVPQEARRQSCCALRMNKTSWSYWCWSIYDKSRRVSSITDLCMHNLYLPRSYEKWHDRKKYGNNEELRHYKLKKMH
jgi:hypothetical protein